MQDLFNKIHSKDYEGALRTVELLAYTEDKVNTGLICL